MRRGPPQRPLPPRRPARLPTLGRPPVVREDPETAKARWNEKIITNLLEAVRTGGHCSLLQGPEEAAAISPSGLSDLTTHELWPEAMRRIAEVETVHPRAQQRFLRFWDGSGWMVRGLVGDDDVFFRALRKMFPPYRGRTKVLFRGQLAGMWVGPSWTTNFNVAEEYAGDGIHDQWSETEAMQRLPEYHFRIPRHLMLRPLPNRRPVILKAKMRGEIIAKLPKRRGFFNHSEYICDPRGVTYESFSITDLPDPRI